MRSRLLLYVSILLSNLLPASVALSQTDVRLTGMTHIYVDSFGNKPGASELRVDFISELRRSKLADVVSSRAEANATISGTGELWIKGYYSLNPRSGRSPSNGQPVYSGVLSVELKGKDGDTMWSYLVTPKSGSTATARDLTKEIVKQLSEAIADASAHK